MENSYSSVLLNSTSSKQSKQSTFSPLHVFNTLLVFLILINSVATTVLPRFAWMNAEVSSDIFGEFEAYRGLFMSCSEVAANGFLCYGLEQSIFDVDSTFHILRFLAIVSILVTIGALILNFIGADYTKCFGRNKSLKRNLMIRSGLLMLLAGLLNGGLSIWFTVVITQEYFSSSNPDEMFRLNVDQLRYEFGYCLYLTYVGTVLCFISAVISLLRPGRRKTRRSARSTPLSWDSKIDLKMNHPFWGDDRVNSETKMIKTDGFV